ncbi:hypothetical protein IF2G_03148 [Cordyceps javanica]|nr:hypothetical protein IF2G_03148 [Cordyceps javanica]
MGHLVPAGAVRCSGVHVSPGDLARLKGVWASVTLRWWGVGRDGLFLVVTALPSRKVVMVASWWQRTGESDGGARRAAKKTKERVY